MYDVVILGAGPAGLSAGIYAGRAKLKTLIIEMERDGGQITETSRVENYPGQIPGGETGEELVARMTKQCEDFGCERAHDTVREVIFADQDPLIHKVIGQNGTYEAKTVIIATGASPKPTGVKNEDKFRGMGVSYCATCDANFFKDLDIYVVGGDNSAAGGALYLSKFGKHVYMIHRGSELTASETMKERVEQDDKITEIGNSVVTELGGTMDLSEITVKDVNSGELTTYQADPVDGMIGVFFMGTRPNTDLFAATELNVDDKGYIPTDEEMQTNIPGVYAAGDVRVKSLRQVVTAAADGAIAAVNAGKYARAMRS
jgi:thioredoxin reductase (NADPH)